MVRISKTSSALILVLGGIAFFTLVYSLKGVSLSDVKNTKLYVQKYGQVESELVKPEVVDEIKPLISTWKTEKTEKTGKPGRTKVYRHNGQQLERLHDFCTWTLPMDTANLKTPGGPITIYIHDVEDDPGLSGILKKTGIRDPENVDIVINELKKDPDAGFFDFGCHIGVYALSIAHTLGRSVVAVDPMIENMMRVCKSIQKNRLTDKMTIVYSAISNNNSKVSFNRVHKHIGATTVVKSSKADQSSDDEPENFSVTMDELIPLVPFKSAVMKLDVEKSEYFAVQGGQKFLEAINVHSILMEWYNIVQTPYGGPLVELMKKLKYVPYLPETSGKHKRLNYEDYKIWRKQRWLLDILWMKE